ncbi:hypothetical protein J3459_010630 [Metarhizium acridum]|uniref:uncharacterized protein n=1 Tax=Metarhizium acridum TaxID=92637 RepID=UPI001C6D23B9|nr:hypothetical protein J3458_020966 [Metarhizium acridum]KAG8422142.1 hypothetical protein J3459_010630 [Metarhizium acridum]
MNQRTHFPRIIDQTDAGSLAPTGEEAVAVGMIIIVYGYQWTCTLRCLVRTEHRNLISAPCHIGGLGALEARLRGCRRSNEPRRNSLTVSCQAPGDWLVDWLAGQPGAGHFLGTEYSVIRDNASSMLD